jgi:hypothetical protein
VKMLDMLAANKTAVMSYHFAWPGFGHVVKNGDGFLFVPKAFPGSISRAGFQPPCAKLPSQTTANLSRRRHERRAGRSRIFQP